MRRTLPALALIVFAACESPTSPIVNPELWYADLVPAAEYADITAAAEVLAGTQAFAAAVEIDDAEPQASFAWHIAEGTCAEPGDRLGTAANYPGITVNAAGFGTATSATIPLAVQPTGEYHALIYSPAASEEAADVPVACGNLERDA